MFSLVYFLHTLARTHTSTDTSAHTNNTHTVLFFQLSVAFTFKRICSVLYLWVYAHASCSLINNVFIVNSLSWCTFIFVRFSTLLVLFMESMQRCFFSGAFAYSFSFLETFYILLFFHYQCFMIFRSVTIWLLSLFAVSSLSPSSITHHNHKQQLQQQEKTKYIYLTSTKATLAATRTTTKSSTAKITTNSPLPTPLFPLTFILTPTNITSQRKREREKKSRLREEDRAYYSPPPPPLPIPFHFLFLLLLSSFSSSSSAASPSLIIARRASKDDWIHLRDPA